MNHQQYIRNSLELHLGFLRIMKEHALFIVAALPQKNKDLINQGINFNSRYNDLLSEVVRLSNNNATIQNYALTNMTLEAEEKTQSLSGLAIDTELTKIEMNLANNKKTSRVNSEELISSINTRAIELTEDFVVYKTIIINGVLDCSLFIKEYPELMHHIREEALNYIDNIKTLEKRVRKELTTQEILRWNHFMAEHAEFVRGYLDPSETELMQMANSIAEKFMAIRPGQNLYNDSLKLTEEIRRFKEKATREILNCNLKSIIIPLLSDHILREANYYLSILQSRNE